MRELCVKKQENHGIGNIRYTSFQMDMFVLMAVETGAGMDEDGWNGFLSLTETKHTVQRAIGAMVILSHHWGVHMLAVGVHSS